MFSNAPGASSCNRSLMKLASALFYLNWQYLRPCLKRALPCQAIPLVQALRAQFQPSLRQYAPRPLRLPRQTPSLACVEAANLPVVSIVTPSFNHAPFLARTICSVLDQEYPKLEYIIQDGGSTDGTLPMLKTFRAKLTHVESCADQGQAHAINLGFRHATGEIMAWLNSDDVLLPGALASVVNFFLAHPDVDALFGDRICLDAKDRDIGRWLLPSGAEKVLPWANYIPQETLFWRRRIWERSGGAVNPTFQFALDWEMLLRFSDAGAKFAKLPRFLGAFRVHPAQKTSACEEIGRQEMARLHTQYHGRAVTWLEIRYHVRRYLARCVWRYMYYYLTNR